MKEYLVVTERQIKSYYSDVKKSDISDETVELMLELVEFINGEIDEIEMTYKDKASAGYKRRVAINFLKYFNELDMVDVYVRKTTLHVHEHDEKRLKRKMRARTTEGFRNDLLKLKNGEIESISVPCKTKYKRKYLMKVAKEELGYNAIIYSEHNVVKIEREKEDE